MKLNYIALAARGNTISMYNSYATDIAALQKAEQKNDMAKAEKIRKKIQKGFDKQQKSIDKLTDKTDKKLAKAYASITILLQNNSHHATGCKRLRRSDSRCE